jgi:hypothetical protein
MQVDTSKAIERVLAGEHQGKKAGGQPKSKADATSSSNNNLASQKPTAASTDQIQEYVYRHVLFWVKLIL